MERWTASTLAGIISAAITQAIVFQSVHGVDRVSCQDILEAGPEVVQYKPGSAGRDEARIRYREAAKRLTGAARVARFEPCAAGVAGGPGSG